MPATTAILPGRIADRYAIERVLGEGATAVVYLARDLRSGGPVAIKLLRAELADSTANARFLREIRRTAELQHRRILPVLDAGEHQGVPFYVLPYMDGGTLRDRLRRERQLPIDEAIAIVAGIAEALDYAHERGLIHRDVKPENILFNEGEAMLGDFGIARAFETTIGETITSTGIVRGTPAYMSPEQASGSTDYDGRSDIYSLACVLYELLAGVPAFMGATPEAVIAQRFTHAPRGVRVYRGTAPPALEQVLARALALSPADRYRTAGEFASAIRAAQLRAEPALRRKRWWVLAAAAAPAVALLAMLVTGGDRARADALDTTRVVVLPFDGDGDLSHASDLLFEGLHRYRGLSLVESFATVDAIRRRGGITSLDDAYAVARSLNAGRLVRGRIAVLGTARTAYAALYDVPTRSELYHARVPVPTDSTRLVSAFAALADSVVLRGRGDGAMSASPGESISLPSVQAMLRGRAALSEWDLSRAEQHFAQTVRHDSSHARGHLWLAMVRVWQDRRASEWAAHVRRARADSLELSAGERRQADALIALAQGEFPRACDIYRRLTRDQPADFVAWYGLGECHRRDRVVVPDPRSPSGWRFRSSYYRAMLAYARAFESFPTAYRQFHGGSYEQLQSFLFTNARLRPGTTADSTLHFLALPAWLGDTIAFIPYPRSEILAGHMGGAGVGEGRLRGRLMFRDIATKWAHALPHSAETKEALAIALEMLGDVEAARDSFRAARALTSDGPARVRLASNEVLADAKQLLRNPSHDFSRSLALSDSLMALPPSADQATADRLARVAVLTGRCDLARVFLRQAARPLATPVPIPPSTTADLHAALPRVVMGCESPAAMPNLEATLARVGGTGADRLLSEYMATGVLAAMFPEQRTRDVERFAALTGDYVLSALDSTRKGNRRGAAQLLQRQKERRRAAQIRGMLPDAGLPEARLWLRLGDTTAAVEVLDASLREFAAGQPLESRMVLSNAVMLASIVPILRLRAELARGRREATDPWATVVRTLWQHADPRLRASAGL